MPAGPAARRCDARWSRSRISSWPPAGRAAPARTPPRCWRSGGSPQADPTAAARDIGRSRALALPDVTGPRPASGSAARDRSENVGDDQDREHDPDQGDDRQRLAPPGVPGLEMRRRARRPAHDQGGAAGGDRLIALNVRLLEGVLGALELGTQLAQRLVSLARQLRQLHSQPIPLRRQLVALEDELVALGAQLRLAPRLLLQAGQELLALHRPLLALCQQAIALDGGPVPLSRHLVALGRDPLALCLNLANGRLRLGVTGQRGLALGG